MSNCKECGRPLDKRESDLCPACMSAKSHKKKRRTEIITGVLLCAVGFLKGFAAVRDPTSSHVQNLSALDQHLTEASPHSPEAPQPSAVSRK